MKYFSIILILLALAACGKKTEPLSKDSLESVAPPAKVIVRASADGVFISNNEDGFLLIAKGIMVGETCPSHEKLKILEPGGDFLDRDVDNGQAYSYQIVKRTVKYKLLSPPRIFPITYSVPPIVESAKVEDNTVKITSSKDFMRLDVTSGNKNVLTTGKSHFDISPDIKNFQIVLTDKYGNKGTPYTVALNKEKPSTLASVTNLTAVEFNNSLRIVWDSVRDADSYSINVCSDTCTEISPQLPFAVYNKTFDKCVDITVKALNSKAGSEASTIRFCK